VTRIGRWEGELLQMKKDGIQILVASRWSLQRDEKGDPIAILMSNNDIPKHVLARAELEKAFEEIKRLKDEINGENLALREQIAGASSSRRLWARPLSCKPFCLGSDKLRRPTPLS
jgi:hypothetical protein